jgi:hypothetical protein
VLIETSCYKEVNFTGHSPLMSVPWQSYTNIYEEIHSLLVS